MKPVTLSFHEDSTLQDVYNYLCENESLYVYCTKLGVHMHALIFENMHGLA